MKVVAMMLGLVIPFIARVQGPDFSSYPVYHGSDLGLTYSPKQSFFRVWSPSANRLQLVLYSAGTGGEALNTHEMEKAASGTWTIAIPGDHKGKFYVFKALIGDKWMNEVPDPYAKLVGINGRRGMIGDLEETDPPGWKKDKGIMLKSPTDAIIYELHVRDASIALNSGIANKGKFLGLTEKGTTNNEGLSTGLDHIKELGVTHVHLLPVYDFYSIDESKPDKPQYNWGYEPLNYDTPEGSYATDPYDGRVRVREFKQLIKTLHENGLNVVMDVVYNHTMLTEDSYFNQLVPGYYYRQDKEGKFSNATACGNETASERPMMRKFMIESLYYWAKEYHIDGFRVDLMGVHDITTMNEVAKELRKINPGILLYGEGWTAGPSPLPDSLRALKKNAHLLDGIAVFSDDIRDGIKGNVFAFEEKGFASGRPGMEESIKFGVVASCPHPQVDYSKVNYSKEPYARDPSAVVTYAECHDNHVLWDKLAISAKDASEDQRKQMYKLALGIVLTSQGISFLHAGSEFLRSKNGHENSFDAGDSINAIDWSLKTKNKDILEYVKALVKLRKDHPAFRMRTGKDIQEHIRFIESVPAGVVAYSINGAAVNDKWKKIIVVHNSNQKEVTVNVSSGNWKKLSLPGQPLFFKPGKTTITAQPLATTILYQE